MPATAPPDAGRADPGRAAEGAQPEPVTATPRARRVLLTGGAGFIGGAIARTLRDRGDSVVALVRDRGRAGALDELGAEIVEDDLSDVDRLTGIVREQSPDSIVHAAGSYRIGIRKSERGAMWDANVGTTTRVLDAAEAAGTTRVVYVSTVNVFGNTRGQVVDETYRRDLGDGFLSWYDETKYGAHEVAEQRIRDGAPITVAMPSQVYGPGDHTEVGDQLRGARDGKLMYRALDDVGFGLVHVDDLARGIVAVLDDGQVGHQYVLSGPTTTLGDAIALAAAIGGRRSPALHVPTPLLSVMRPLGGIIGRPNLGEVISAAAGVTYWASAARARQELGWQARDLEAGFRDAFGTS